jgi:hypothetical protein
MENLKSNTWYEKTWLAILLCVIFFPVGLYALWKNPSIGKFWKIVITAIIAIILIASIGSSDKKSTTSSVTEINNTEASKAKQWTVVYEFKGNGMKKSPAFELTGGNARIKYKYNGQGGVGMGMFAVYVVDEGKDLMVEGGIPEIMTQAETEESESAIQKSSGKYYLSVDGIGNWIVSVEEEK